jgi:hypothetical protein
MGTTPHLSNGFGDSVCANALSCQLSNVTASQTAQAGYESNLFQSFKTFKTFQPFNRFASFKSFNPVFVGRDRVSSIKESIPER